MSVCVGEPLSRNSCLASEGSRQSSHIIIYTGCCFSAEREHKSHSGCVKWIEVDLVFLVKFQSEIGLYSCLQMLNALNWITHLRGSTLQNVKFISIFQGYCFLDLFPEMSSAGSPRGWGLCHPLELLVPSLVTPLEQPHSTTSACKACRWLLLSWQHHHHVVL